MILEQIIIILKILILGIFIAIMFDNISRYCNHIVALFIWLPITYVICRVIVNITIYFEITYIIYYLLLIVLAYYIYYKCLKKDLNNVLDKITNFIKSNKKIKRIINFLFLVNEVKYIKIKLKNVIRKIKLKKD